jgi:Family of unknown function (DUF6272)
MAIDNFNNTSDFLEFVYGFYKTMKANEIRLSYEGKMSHQITKAFIALAEAQMVEDQEAIRVQRIIFHVMVECLQNVSRHADDDEPKDNVYSGNGIFMMSRDSNAYYITTGNAILNEKIPALKNMIDKVNELDSPMLKDFYMKQMREGRLSDKGGAGLGFIDIRRKTGSKLEYYFLPVSDKMSFFMLTTAIPRTL